METLTTLLSSGFLLAIIATPILIYWRLQKRSKLRYRFLTYLVWSLVLSGILVFAFVWWGDYSSQLLLRFYGVDLTAVTEADRYAQVLAENRERVHQLEISYWGMGWPLKGLFVCAICWPYLIVVYFVGFELKKYFSRLQISV